MNLVDSRYEEEVKFVERERFSCRFTLGSGFWWREMCWSFKAAKKTCQSASSQETNAGAHSQQLQLVAQSGSLNLNDEYAKAFRTKSYAEFWKKVQNVTEEEEIGQCSSSSSSPFHLYGVLADHILEPDQAAIHAILERGLPSRIPELYSLVADYFYNSAEASRLCGALLKNIEQAKINYRSIRNVLDATPSTGDFTNEQCNFSITELHFFIQVENPFANSTPQTFQNIHECYAAMLKRLEVRRKKILRKLRLVKGCKKASVVCLIVASVALAVCAVVIASHALIAIIAGPLVVWLPVPCQQLRRRVEGLRVRVLQQQSFQLDAAAKGAYILNRDFDTMSRLVTRLHDEVEHDKGIIRFCLQRRDERHPVQEVVRQLRRNDSNFNKQLDELEKHVYLCFMTINRARMLVVQEIQMHHASDTRQVQRV